MATLAPARWVLLGLGGGAVLAGAYLFAPDLWHAVTAPEAEDVAATAPRSPPAGPSPVPLPPRDEPRARPSAAPSAPTERAGSRSASAGATGAPAVGATVPAAPAAGAGATAPAAPAPQEPPRFDVVRIGARGTAVVAGRARPGAEVVLVLDGAQEIGRARADVRGEWVILPAEPLAPGARELSLRARHAGEETAGPDTVVVLVPDPAPLEVAAAPRQRHAAAPQHRATQPGGSTQSAEPRQADAPSLPSPSQPVAPRDAAAAPAAAAAAEPGRAAAADVGPAAPPRAAADLAATAARPMPAPAPDERTAAPATPFAVLLPPPLPLAPAPDAAAGGRGAAEIPALPRVLQAPPPGGSAAPETAAAQPAPRAAPSAARLALEAVEYDDSGAMRFAGTAPPGAVVRVYVGQRHAGDTRADAAGRWVFTPAEPPSYGVHTLRLDQIAASGSVAARIELPFQRDRLPASAFAAPAAPPAAPTETAAAAAPRESTAPGDAASGAPTSATVPRAGRLIVQPGHNLWRIARETYGQGVRYTIIYQANRDQIRDPDLIYPGQIFTLPAPHPQASPATPADSSRSR